MSSELIDDYAPLSAAVKEWETRPRSFRPDNEDAFVSGWMAAKLWLITSGKVDLAMTRPSDALASTSPSPVPHQQGKETEA